MFHSFFKILHVKLKEILLLSFFKISFSFSFFLKIVFFHEKVCQLMTPTLSVRDPKVTGRLCVISLDVEMWMRQSLAAELAVLLFCDSTIQGHENTETFFLRVDGWSQVCAWPPAIPTALRRKPAKPKNCMQKQLSCRPFSYHLRPCKKRNNTINMQTFNTRMQTYGKSNIHIISAVSVHWFTTVFLFLFFAHGRRKK